ncbi:MAG: transcription elongation factor GreB [Polyangiaceae bacterium]|nr:transcription elongation factor GreB [Polyangiaceae bacterium]
MATYLTPDGAKALAAELKSLLEVERPRVVSEVTEAAAHGDRSENAEYKYGKKRLREIDHRIRAVTKRLDSAVIVAPDPDRREDVVYFGATVFVTDENGVDAQYHLVGPDEADPSIGKISFQSPIGCSLMKKAVGDVVVVKRPAGELELEITAVEY